MQPDDLKLCPRTPTEAMIAAGYDALQNLGNRLHPTADSTITWQAMFDAALALPRDKLILRLIADANEEMERADEAEARAAPALTPVPEIEALVERVAEAMWNANKLVGCSKGFHEGASDPWEACEDKDDYRFVARAALDIALQSQAAETARLRAMCEELAGAVEPFAKIDCPESACEWTKLSHLCEISGKNPTAADVRRARTAYAQYQESKGGGG